MSSRHKTPPPQSDPNVRFLNRNSTISSSKLNSSRDSIILEASSSNEAIRSTDAPYVPLVFNEHGFCEGESWSSVSPEFATLHSHMHSASELDSVTDADLKRAKVEHFPRLFTPSDMPAIEHITGSETLHHAQDSSEWSGHAREVSSEQHKQVHPDHILDLLPEELRHEIADAISPAGESTATSEQVQMSVPVRGHLEQMPSLRLWFGMSCRKML